MEMEENKEHMADQATKPRDELDEESPTSSCSEKKNKRKTPEDNNDDQFENNSCLERNFSKKPRKSKPGFDNQMFKETSFERKNGLRYIKPYFFTFTAHCKGRWLGNSLINVFKKEFRMQTVEYYEKAIKIGKITLNDKVVSKDTVLTSNHILKTKVHRHEPPVIDKPFEFIENSELMAVIDKPSSIPVHPCGRYRHNTAVFILGEEYGLKNLHTIHRIDRLTSGILMFAKTKEKAQELEQCVKGRLVQKEYLCRVKGKFPEDPVICKEPIKVVSHKVGVCQVDKEGKEATTEFIFQSYNGQSSVVRCIPSTGRMHQIRVHLQYIGFPIINDPVYNHPSAWGSNKGKGGTERNIDEILKTLADTRKDKAQIEKQKVKSNGVSDIKLDHSTQSSTPEASTSSTTGAYLHAVFTDEDNFDADCADCLNPLPEPEENELVMYLHALKYTGPDWKYETKVPDWAKADWHQIPSSD